MPYTFGRMHSSYVVMSATFVYRIRCYTTETLTNHETPIVRISLDQACATDGMIGISSFSTSKSSFHRRDTNKL
jgi:hypothetical protein